MICFLSYTSISIGEKMTTESILAHLNYEQGKVCCCEDNLIVNACPGSGKTRTISYKLAYLQNKYPTSLLKNIAITFTNRAADEIVNRLDGMNMSLRSVWIGTIHQFCMEYIIRPYSMYSIRLKNGYRIIDEKEVDDYKLNIIEELGYEKKDFYKKKNDPKVLRKYDAILRERREIDFNLILDISYDLLVENKFIAENISSLIRTIQVDEYQDTNERQYAILAEIVKQNPSLHISFIGDVNQAIYGNLGGVVKTRREIENLFNCPFIELPISGCYRSTKRIVEYYSYYEIERCNTYSLSPVADKIGCIMYDKLIHKDCLASEIVNIIEESHGNGIPYNEICIIAPQWIEIFSITKELRRLLPNVPFDAPDVSPFKADKLNPFYLIARLVFTQKGEHVSWRMKTADEIIVLLKKDYSIYISPGIDSFYILKQINSVVPQNDDGIDFYISTVKYLFNKLNISLEKEDKLNKTFNSYVDKSKGRVESQKLEVSISAIKKHFAERSGVVINTVHGIKGEEYTTVIAFDLLQGKIPHRSIHNKEISNKEAKKLLYVICSRAKENIYLFSETNRKDGAGILYGPTEVLDAVIFDYN